MGRKIPGRKHKGVKDPEKQRRTRFNLIKNKINLAPANPDEQQVPKSLSWLAELKEKTKQGAFDRGRKKTATARTNRQPAFRRMKGESDSLFVHRVSRICEERIKEAKFADKYGVEIKRNHKTGKVEEVVKRKPDEIDLLMKRSKKRKKTKSKNQEPRLTKSQKRRKKLTEKKQKRELNRVNEFGDYRDEVKFGEVVHAPPALTLPRKIEPTHCAPRPGKKDLLLKSALNGGITDNKKTTQCISDVKLKKTVNKIIDKKGKRKELPHALRRQLDKQRDEIVSVYKKLKEQKYSQRQ